MRRVLPREATNKILPALNYSVPCQAPSKGSEWAILQRCGNRHYHARRAEQHDKSFFKSGLPASQAAMKEWLWCTRGPTIHAQAMADTNL